MIIIKCIDCEMVWGLHSLMMGGVGDKENKLFGLHSISEEKKLKESLPLPKMSKKIVVGIMQNQ